jgi:hypothetical protein
MCGALKIMKESITFSMLTSSSASNVSRGTLSMAYSQTGIFKGNCIAILETDVQISDFRKLCDIRTAIFKSLIIYRVILKYCWGFRGLQFLKIKCYKGAHVEVV